MRIKPTAILLSFLLAFGAEAQERAHFHHVGLNVIDVKASQTFYQEVLGATAVRFNGRQPALFTERSFILLSEVAEPAFPNLETTLWHIGWGGVDGPNEYEWWKNQGVEFYTPVRPLGENHYMYFFGPDKELIEIYTGDKHHRFNHVHFLASDPQATAQWFQQALALPDIAVRKGGLGATITIDNVQMIIFPNTDRYRPPEQGETLKPTDDSSIGHLGFSFRDLSAARERIAKLDNIELLSEIQTSERHGLPSFFARATDGLLVEFVQAKPIPEGIWE